MQLSDFSFNLPDELIARYPLAQRSASRLLHLNSEGQYSDRHFTDILELFEPGDLLVLNDTKVMKARLKGRRATGGAVEILVERIFDQTIAHCHIKASNSPKAGAELFIGADEVKVTVQGRHENLFVVEFSQPILQVLDQHGQLPIPPYFNREAEAIDSERYQTVFHDPEKIASVAAPTASLHFDEVLLNKLSEKGVQQAFVTLHVGAGTFLPVRSIDIENHIMHSEWCEVPENTVELIKQVQTRGNKVIAVGTTATRALESAAQAHNGKIEAWTGDTQIFIYPGYQFCVVDRLITNFHLPESTLLMLVSALSTRDHILAAYEHAVRKHYRFFSYGDAMLIDKTVNR
ncbi:tRNA preQ1(34) S-adenosylmethionine ribosyltransferase-isomerase QueA [Acinetobacter radioresistens]|jgi:S-adenosylmethionine:tRNA ribosyltransferase-isomerase|uniref:S-adenosylmethionine:tRNA ribosyltransferase-isomerase n=1 Tax=Acinetobacter radioresistens TaxID=40216 RepID=A0A3D3FXE3_ACIRA|nr:MULTISPECIES: tRNA preQ1(34) S-adenosylmethionine ribosyltransferase-isomerase QueA [Acinetobacter]EEY86294.1 S-adenosylmethionine:tRNA ribosyltransferase-isomerase [Acinetobacter radioresistens SH164]ENV87203.1 S-adenosylmethionine:tRNA ribosyltransferase-isomerase [Acinetobacter radioresistens NIPH 2130]EXB88045.1 tRNA ribosyltransferase-isomerase [Acinetobacter sp. 272263]MBA5696098.1 tRNA preQ1(34) S-adenosylmethionine ribosyltransferase-isomerase QueA [Acinetobacter radioresistens]MBA5